jgi:DNA-directed RNA polymerase subunit RPC12/RpoP
MSGVPEEEKTMRYQCPNCDREARTIKELRKLGCDCKSQPLQMLDPKDHEERKSKNESYEIMADNFKTLQPITFFEDFRAILVYLPAKKITGDKVEYGNFAHFVVSDNQEKRILVFNDPELTQNYQVRVIPQWNNVRWEYSDIQKWLTEEKTDPKLVYELLDRKTRRFLEFASEAQYIKFNLWNIGTYFYPLFDAYPINDFTGTKAAGKTKSLVFQTLVCYNGFMSGSMSPSALFRLREGTGGFIAIDETEQFKNQKNENAQELRTLLLQSFLKNQHAVRVEGTRNGGFNVRSFNLYGPTSLAHINTFDDVLEDRCIPQLNRRAINESIKNAWPSHTDPDFQKIRNLCYRLFLDYADEVNKLQSEARNLLPISGRELQLWLPIITLALFFEKHGIPGLTEQIKALAIQISEERKLQDEQESHDRKVLDFLIKEGVKLGQDKEQRKGNPEGWVPSKVLYDTITSIEEYGFSKDHFSQRYFGNILRRLGLDQAKKQGGISFLVTDEKINELKQRWGLDDTPGNVQNVQNVQITHKNSEHSTVLYSETSEKVQKNYARSEQTEQSEQKGSLPEQSPPKIPPLPGPEYRYFCRTCGNGHPMLLAKESIPNHSTHDIVIMPFSEWQELVK